ncbi:hypothetical protein CC86DRAFT_30602 [Ophiobolus disseminans]|uniref:Uncharacterized protein n=1 Tax=Ophiobolus disseminans TaxID=1469910 RepID=A0A6A7A151_9PLEO|nr:hypothetical protein CC86DRAFT_30602 [Ophiobolus disseminans]
MRVTIITATLFAAFAATAPIDSKTGTAVNEAGRSVRLKLASADPATVQTLSANGQPISIKARFGAIMNNRGEIRADRAQLVGAAGSCKLFSDAQATKLVAVANADDIEDVKFPAVDLGDGVVVCQP